MTLAEDYIRARARLDATLALLPAALERHHAEYLRVREIRSMPILQRDSIRDLERAERAIGSALVALGAYPCHGEVADGR